ncbi:MAG TPA: EscU/YscU/HrcU family type III secretion system export apparatus switch protein [Pirellulales bacterium]|jgi:flagellar biosynthetic protein FlhB|nr:EscU/YscU/HrcU family type III secretion system export apparatus switch protein [Pirellulales bacterium]
MAEEHVERTQPPTPRRREQMRAAGHVAHSPDVSSAGVLLASLVTLSLAGGALVQFLASMLAGHLSGGFWLAEMLSADLNDGDVVAQLPAVLMRAAKVLLPVLGTGCLMAIGLNLLQLGPRFRLEKLAPDFSRINPVAGLGRLMSSASAARFGFGILKVVAILCVAGTSLYAWRGELMTAGEHELAQIASLAWQVCLGTAVKIGLALAVLAIIDYGYQRWSLERKLWMTPQELREEMRNLEGDPSLLARRRAVRAQGSERPGSTSIARASVVVAGSQCAVALRYDPSTMRVPMIVARGVGPLAGQMRALAAEEGVAIVEQEALAAALYKESRASSPISIARFSAVAQILTAVSRRAPLAHEAS